MTARDVSVSELFDELRKANLRAVEAEEKLAALASAPVANRERVAEVLHGFSNGEPVDGDGWVLFADELEDFANALLAAGVFRDEATVKAELAELIAVRSQELIGGGPGDIAAAIAREAVTS
jgi:hypothetical protein